MSLASVYDACVAGCVAIPQHGVTAVETGKFALSMGVGVNRPFFRWFDDVRIEFNCPSPPAVFSFNVFEKSAPDVSATDPIFSAGCYLTACSSPGFALNTSRWFTVVFTAYHFFGVSDSFFDWMHIMNYHDPDGSIGLLRSGVPLP